MSRWIDADKMLEITTKYIASVFPNSYKSAKQDAELLVAMEEAEHKSIDIVRCKECKHWKGDGAFTLNELGEEEQLCKWWSKFGTIRTAENAFCSYGERRE